LVSNCPGIQQELKGWRLIAKDADFVVFAPFASRFRLRWECFPNLKAARSAGSVLAKLKTAAESFEEGDDWFNFA
jgi:hypothetical protein